MIFFLLIVTFPVVVSQSISVANYTVLPDVIVPTMYQNPTLNCADLTTMANTTWTILPKVWRDNLNLLPTTFTTIPPPYVYVNNGLQLTINNFTTQNNGQYDCCTLNPTLSNSYNCFTQLVYLTGSARPTLNVVNNTNNLTGMSNMSMPHSYNVDMSTGVTTLNAVQNNSYFLKLFTNGTNNVTCTTNVGQSTPYIITVKSSMPQKTGAFTDAYIGNFQPTMAGPYTCVNVPASVNGVPPLAQTIFFTVTQSNNTNPTATQLPDGIGGMDLLTSLFIVLTGFLLNSI